MKIDIHELINKPEIMLKSEYTVSLLGFNLSHDTQQCVGSIVGKITKKGTRYIVEGKISGIVTLLCDRCIKEFEYPIYADLYKEFSTEFNETLQDEDIIQITQSSIDLSDVIVEALYLNRPMKAVCKENCKGICLVCGKDLNEHTCECLNTDIDPRLEKLKNIFHPQSED